MTHDKEAALDDEPYKLGDLVYVYDATPADHKCPLCGKAQNEPTPFYVVTPTEAAHAPLSDDEESPRVYPPETGVERGSEAREDDAWLRRSLAHLVEHASGDTIRVGVLEALLRTTGEDEGGGL